MSVTPRQSLAEAKRWVVKVGSALLTAGGSRLDNDVITKLATQLMTLRTRGCEVILVSSGSVAAGVARLGYPERPRELHELQAAAAVGQSALIRAYEDTLARHAVTTAQILLSHADVRARDRYLNARATLNTLIGMGVLPIINENDTVVTDEIRLGDNDTLAALVANLIDADALLILTDQSGLYDKNPQIYSDAVLVAQADVNDSKLDTMVGEGGALGRGGMITKLRAARLAARSGTMTVIASGSHDNVVPAVAAGDPIGTFLTTTNRPQSARKQWLASLMHAKGALILDHGAAQSVCQQGRSLLPIGITAVQGQFERGDLVACLDPQGREVARGLVNYSSDEACLLVQTPSAAITSKIGYGGDPEMIHRDNMVHTSL